MQYEMKITIAPTDVLTNLDGVPVRLWKGTTADGVECLVFVHRVAVREDEDVSRFDAELSRTTPPGCLARLKWRSSDVHEGNGGRSMNVVPLSERLRTAAEDLFRAATKIEDDRVELKRLRREIAKLKAEIERLTRDGRVVEQ